MVFLFISSLVGLFIVCAHARVCMHVCQDVHVEVRRSYRSWFPPPAMHDLGTKLRLSGLALNTFTAESSVSPTVLRFIKSASD